MITVSSAASAEFSNCTFTNMETMAEGAVMTAEEKSVVKISQSTFTNNSAVEGSVFKINTESLIR